MAELAVARVLYCLLAGWCHWSGQDRPSRFERLQGRSETLGKGGQDLWVGTTSPHKCAKSLHALAGSCNMLFEEQTRAKILSRFIIISTIFIIR